MHKIASLDIFWFVVLWLMSSTLSFAAGILWHEWHEVAQERSIEVRREQ